MDIHDIPDEQLRSGVTGVIITCHMDFRDNPKWWWTGWGELITLDGQKHVGTGDVIQISSLQQSYGTSAGFVRFVVPNASSEMIRNSRNQDRQVNGRLCKIGYQIFTNDASGDEHRGRLIGNPVNVFVGKMKDVTTSVSAEERTIELEAYGRLSKQTKAPYGRFNSTDQKRRHMGDKGFDLLPSLKDKTVVWVPGD